MVETFAVLLVCTGNVCRSPTAEYLLATRYSALPMSFSSAGTGATAGQPMQPQALEVATELGAGPAIASHRARQLSAEMVADADLVIAMARDNRRQIAQLNPSAIRKMFTLRELARIATGLTEDATGTSSSTGVQPSFDAPPTFLSRFASRRGYFPAEDAGSDDVIDPIGRSSSAYESSGKQILAAIVTIEDALQKLRSTSAQ
jgi:protein-tyrosine phosphatase